MSTEMEPSSGGSRTDLDLVLPVIPSNIVDFKVTGNGRAEGWKEVAFAELRVQSKPLQLVLHRILEFGKAKFDAPRVQRLVQFGDGIAGGDVDACDGFRRDYQPTHGCR